MAFDEKLAERLREVCAEEFECTEKKMFGGLGLFDRGNMCCGVVDDELMVRVGPEAYQDALCDVHAREMDFTGRPLNGFVFVAAEGLRQRRSLTRWVRMALEFTSTLPAKAPKPARRSVRTRSKKASKSDRRRK